MKLNLLTLRRILALVLLTVISPFASATPQTAILEFSSPELGISGSFGVNLDPSTQALLDITSVSLTIDGYKYKNKDVGFTYDEKLKYYTIGGLVFGVDFLDEETSNDFYLAWHPALPGEPLEGGYFSYINSGMLSPRSTFVERLSITEGKQKYAKTSEVSLFTFSSETDAVVPAIDVSDSPLGVFALLPVLGLLLVRGFQKRDSE